MRLLLTLPSLLCLILPALANDPNDRVLDPRKPIYLGDVFMPPQMTFIAWIPDEKDSPKYWCYNATDISNDTLFNLGGVDLLKMHDYFSKEAYITKQGKRWASCRITPENWKLGNCNKSQDKECVGGQKFSGPGIRTWSCWVNPGEFSQVANEPETFEKISTEEILTERLTVAMTPTQTGSRGASIGSLKAAFTPGATGKF